MGILHCYIIGATLILGYVASLVWIRIRYIIESVECLGTFPASLTGDVIDVPRPGKLNIWQVNLDLLVLPGLDQSI